MSLSRQDVLDKSKFLDLEIYIKFIKDLPNHLMEHQHGLILDYRENNTDILFFNKIRTLYIAKSTWLEYYLLNRSELISELTLSIKAFHKTQAELSLAWYRIIQECFLLSEELQAEYSNPALFWTLTEYEKLETLFFNSGFIGTPKLMGKSRKYSEIVKISEYLAKPDEWISGTVISPTKWFIHHAACIASHDDNVKFRNNHWRTFLKTVKRCYKEIQNSTTPIIYLEDGEILKFGIGKKKKRPD